jgi:hypothetical protein
MSMRILLFIILFMLGSVPQLTCASEEPQSQERIEVAQEEQSSSPHYVVTIDGSPHSTEQAESWCQRSKKQLFAATVVTTAGIGSFSSCMTTNPWAQATALAISAALVYSGGGFVGPLITLPSQRSPLQKRFIKSLIGACLVVPGNVLNYGAIEMGLAPNSPVNLIALGSLMNLVGTVTGTVGSVVLYHQSPVWTVWVGMLAMAGVSSLQMWYALTHPVANQ